MTVSILNRLKQALLNEETPRVILVAGASGGIGQAFCLHVAQQFPNVMLIRMVRNLEKLEDLPVETQDITFDLAFESSIRQAVKQLPKKLKLDWVFIATGWLHDETHQPEKTFRSLSPEQMTKSFQLNAIGPSVLVKCLLGRVNPKYPMKIGILTARVGSVSDNRLGGWHSYRSSKAALNMLIKNYAIELERMKTSVVIVGLQPGTTDTDLSLPFQRGVSPEHLQTPSYTASQLIKVMQVLDDSNSGNLFDFLGLEFAP
jgi:NAD(P)-dependent dehydrogenase (short-subunit alcohol dehydrogenase family)